MEYSSMKVEIVSRKLVRSSIPTSCHLKSYKISYLDYLIPPINFGIPFFYTRKPERMTDQLEESLSKTLVKFYPLVGRYVKKDRTVDCSDEGVEFIRAKAPKVDLKDLIAERNVRKLNQDFIPLPIYQDGNDEAAPVASFQVIDLKCSGIVLGISYTFVNLHNMDGRICKHGLKAIINTSWSDDDPARRYLSCPNIENDVCKFCDWIGPNVTEIQSEYIKELRVARDSFKVKLDHLGNEYRSIVLKESISATLAAQYRKERDDLEHKIRILETDFSQLKLSNKELEESNGHLVVGDYELRELIDSLKTEAWWKNYMIATLIIMCVVLKS